MEILEPALWLNYPPLSASYCALRLGWLEAERLHNSGESRPRDGLLAQPVTALNKLYKIG